LAKLLLLSILVAAIAIPVLNARDPNPHRGFKRTLVFFGMYCLFYVLVLKFLYLKFI
jgi:hypothetical protein